ncbi:MAG: hypothetical protein LBB09_02370 [Rickettsiales bacterium]|jgi:hypothetical protein|nr:hypothetical protein [Rickettsiales bacterium]
MKKFFFIAILAIFALGFSFLVGFNSSVVVRFGDYELISDANFLLFACAATVLAIVNIVSGYYVIRSANEKKYFKQNRDIRQKYERCMELIAKAVLHNLNGNARPAEKKLGEAKKILGDCDLMRIVESQILLKKEKYQAAADVFKTVEPGENYFIDNINLTRSLKSKNQPDIEFFCKKILKYRANDRWAMINLYRVYRENLNWPECKNLLRTIKKYAAFSDEDIRIEKKIIETNLNAKPSDND